MPTKKSYKQLKKTINRLPRDEKMELLWQLDCAYCKIYNMEYSNTRQDALCELTKIHSIVKKSLQ